MDTDFEEIVNSSTKKIDAAGRRTGTFFGLSLLTLDWIGLVAYDNIDYYRSDNVFAQVYGSLLNGDSSAFALISSILGMGFVSLLTYDKVVELDSYSNAALSFDDAGRQINYKVDGFFKKKDVTLDTTFVSSVSYEQSLTQKLFGYGSVTIRTSNPQETIVLDYVTSPQKAAALILEKVSVAKSVNSLL